MTGVEPSARGANKRRDDGDARASAVASSMLQSLASALAWPLVSTSAAVSESDSVVVVFVVVVVVVAIVADDVASTLRREGDDSGGGGMPTSVSSCVGDNRPNDEEDEARDGDSGAAASRERCNRYSMPYV